MRLFGHVGVFFRTKDDLGKSLPIAQIDENHAAMIARDLDPAGQRNLLADIGFTKRIAVVRAVHALSLWANRRIWQAIR